MNQKTVKHNSDNNRKKRRKGERGGGIGYTGSEYGCYNAGEAYLLKVFQLDINGPNVSACCWPRFLLQSQPNLISFQATITTDFWELRLALFRFITLIVKHSSRVPHSETQVWTKWLDSSCNCELKERHFNRNNTDAIAMKEDFFSAKIELSWITSLL